MWTRSRGGHSEQVVSRGAPRATTLERSRGVSSGAVPTVKGVESGAEGAESRTANGAVKLPFTRPRLGAACALSAPVVVSPVGASAGSDQPLLHSSS